jgi:opacity protein-like surface antigen
MRKIALIGLASLLFASVAMAQVPTSGNVFFGYSYYNTNLSPIDRANANGWEASLEGKVLPWVGIVADFSGHYGSENFPAFCPQNPCTINVNVNERNVLFGPRVSASFGKFRPFAEAMFGVGHVNADAAGSDTSFATALGGGLDYRLIRPVAWRFQGDYIQTRFFGTTQNNLRLSTGIVFHF